MTTKELFEFAALDALGLLDEQDQAAFEVAFRAAPSAVQTQLRAEQARACRIEGLLPDVAARPELREMVLAAVRRAQAAAAVEDARSELMPAGRHHRDAGVLAIVRPRRVSPIWRAAAIGSATAAVILGAAFVSIRQENLRLSRVAGQDAFINAISSAVGGQQLIDTLFDAGTGKAVLSSVGPTSAQGSIFYNSKWSSARLVAVGVATKPGEVLRVVEVAADGSMTRDLTGDFTSSGGLLVQDIAVELRTGELPKLALVAVQRGQPSSAGTVLLRLA